jgi:hypothetical protein
MCTTLPGKDVRALHSLCRIAEAPISKFRLPLLVNVINELKVRSIVRGAATCPVRIEYKKFKYTGADQSIFQCCAMLMSQIDTHAFEYNTDGTTPSRRQMRQWEARAGGETVLDPKTKQLGDFHSNGSPLKPTRLTF